MTTAPEVDRAKLEPLLKVGEGGQGVVYLTDVTKINKIWPVAVKEYLPGTTFDAARLRQMAGFVPTLDGPTGLWLCETVAWPAVLVARQGRTSGFLMRRIPDAFYQPWGDKHTMVPAAMQFLLNPETYLNRRGIRITDRQRAQLLLNLADTMARLHSNGIVVGDLSPNNLLVDLSAEPRCFLIDCDAMRLRGEDVLTQVETPEWRVPDGEPIATEASDAYKFALLVVRMFAQDQMGKDLTALDRLSPALAALARRGLGRNSTTRPTPGDWIAALRAAATSAGTPRVTPSSSRPDPIKPPAHAPLPGRSGLVAPRRSAGKIVAAIIAVIAVIALILAIANATGDSNQGAAPVGPPAAVTTAADETTEPVVTETTTDPLQTDTAAAAGDSEPVIGTVDYSAVQDDRAAVAVARLFADYFDAVNSRDWPAALAAFDPSGVVRTASAKAREKFVHDVSTTHDSDATILSMDSGLDPLLVELTFTSTQAAGFGPAKRRGETCTRWHITYRLTDSSAHGYRILNALDASSSAC